MDIIDVGILIAFSIFLGIATGMSGLNLGSGRFPVVAQFESSVPTAIGTVIGITTMLAIATAISSVRSGNVHLKIFYILTAIAVVGCVIGAYFTVLLPGLTVMIMVMFSLLWGIFRMIRSKNSEVTSMSTSHSLKVVDRKYTKEFFLSFIVGTMAGLLGVIIISITLSSLLSAFKLDPKVVVGTALAFTAVLGVCGVLAHIVQGNFNLQILGIMGSAGMIGGVLGTRFSNSITSKNLKMILIGTQVSIFFFLLSIIVLEILRPATIHCNSCF